MSDSSIVSHIIMEYFICRDVWLLIGDSILTRSFISKKVLFSRVMWCCCYLVLLAFQDSIGLFSVGFFCI